MHQFYFLHSFFTLNFLAISSAKMFPLDRKMSDEQISKIKTPSLRKQFFAKFTVAKNNWMLVEMGNFSTDTCLTREATLTRITDPIYKWYGPNSDSNEVDFDKMMPFVDGSIEIRGTTKEDSGTYICTITSISDSAFKETYERTYVVFMNPHYSLQRVYHFTLKDCDDRKTKKILRLAEDSFCDSETVCSFTFWKYTCSWDPEYKSYRLGVVILQKSKEAKLTSNCGTMCKKQEITEQLYANSAKQQTHFEDQLDLNFHSNDKELQHLEEKIEKYLVIECPVGHDKYNDFACVPCDVGTFRSKEYEVCVDCGIFTYQNWIGKTFCKSCGLLKVTAMHGASSYKQCVFFVMSWKLMLVATPSFLVLIVIAMWCFNFSWLVTFPMFEWVCRCCKDVQAKMVSHKTEMSPSSYTPYSTRELAIKNVMSRGYMKNKSYNNLAHTLDEIKMLKKNTKRQGRS